MSDSSNNPPALSIRYQQSTVIHTTQFILSGSAEELVIDCSSGPIPSESAAEQILPIHSRHALPWSAARRLSDSLRQMIDKHDRQLPSAPSQTGGRQASLPRIDNAHV